LYISWQQLALQTCAKSQEPTGNCQEGSSLKLQLKATEKEDVHCMAMREKAKNISFKEEHLKFLKTVLKWKRRDLKNIVTLQLCCFNSLTNINAH